MTWPTDSDTVYERVQRLAGAIDIICALRRDLSDWPVEITDSLHMATVQLEKAQNALIYELGQAERVRRAKP